MQLLAVERDHLVGIVGEEDVVSDPLGGALGSDHFVDLLFEVAPELRVEEHIRHAGADPELEVAELDADFFEGTDAADVEDAKIRRLEPFLAEVARRFLEGVEEVDAELGWLGLKFEEARAGEGALVAGLVGREAHHAAAAAGEHAEVVANEARELVDELGDAVGVGLIEPDGGAIEREHGGLLELAGHLLADKEAVLLLVGVEVEVLGQLVVPVHLDADAVEGVEAGVGVAGEEVAVGAGRLAEDDAPQFEVAEAGEELDVLQQVREEVDDQRVGVGRGVVERLDHGAAANRAGLAFEELAQVLVGADEDAAVLH